MTETIATAAGHAPGYRADRVPPRTTTPPRLVIVEPAPRPPIAFRVRRRTGVWEVTRDSRFFGDYHAETLALEAAEAAIRTITARGGSAALFRAPFVVETS